MDCWCQTFTGRIHFLSPNQPRQSTEGIRHTLMHGKHTLHVLDVTFRYIGIQPATFSTVVLPNDATYDGGEFPSSALTAYCWLWLHSDDILLYVNLERHSTIGDFNSKI